ncbi:DUF7511 domain-containing protein [Natrinema longum]|uniref:DUF7511 domain-containing protein n=1 Tax=Natrinema longum TaxID=370324 RepID=A0A8A2UAA7_9EURY|nr:hypothetical protein [Natrinema longum]MBZ6496369.1 hypothetical protein [Natrinema longum]QSW85721.1 hypothetical protein J0X27_02450 [Natrinema longum]
MTRHETPVPDETQSGVTPLELLSDDEGVWTAVPADASGDERVREWLEIEGDGLCDLEAWR